VSRYRVRLTLEALGDLKRLQAFLIEKDPTAAARAVSHAEALETSDSTLLELYSLPSPAARHGRATDPSCESS
jgi:hypothetical protein